MNGEFSFSVSKWIAVLIVESRPVFLIDEAPVAILDIKYRPTIFQPHDPLISLLEFLLYQFRFAICEDVPQFRIGLAFEFDDF